MPLNRVSIIHLLLSFVYETYSESATKKIPMHLSAKTALEDSSLGFPLTSQERHGILWIRRVSGRTAQVAIQDGMDMFVGIIESVREQLELFTVRFANTSFSSLPVRVIVIRHQTSLVPRSGHNHRIIIRIC